MTMTMTGKTRYNAPPKNKERKLGSNLKGLVSTTIKKIN